MVEITDFVYIDMRVGFLADDDFVGEFIEGVESRRFEIWIFRIPPEGFKKKFGIREKDGKFFSVGL